MGWIIVVYTGYVNLYLCTSVLWRDSAELPSDCEQYQSKSCGRIFINYLEGVVMDKKQDFWGDLSDVDLEIFAVFCLFVISEIALL